MGAYKRKKIVDNLILFDETLNNKEDGLWIMQYAMQARNIVLVEGTCTYYRKHEESITNQYADVQWEADSIYYLLRKWKLWAKEHAKTKQQKKLFWKYRRTWVNGYFDTCSRNRDCSCHSLKNTKLSYKTIVDSNFSSREKFVELLMNIKLIENVYVFCFLKRLRRK